MNVIELERWEPSKEDSNKLEYVGQPLAEEVFAELKQRLDSMGYLPDEYFLMDSHWEDGREIPKGADIFCTTDYGGSEGVYLDVYLKWCEDNKPITRSFITGKTLGENGNDLDRMFLISSAITKAFHGDNATHTRYMKIGGVEDDTGGCVVHLSQREQHTLIDALVEQRERQENALTQTEQVLRRLTGSITAYMDTVGQRPLRLSDYDKASLAIRDGELSAFKELYPKVLKDHADDLLIEAAGRPGEVGRRMTRCLLDDGERFPEAAYRAAFQKAIDINDPRKVALLQEQAESHVEGLAASFFGEMASCAYCEHRFIAKQIVDQCTNEQIAAAPVYLLEQCALGPDYRTMSALVEKGLNAGSSAANVLRQLTHENRDSWMAESLLRERMWVDPRDYKAFHICVQNDAVDVAKLLLEGGVDFEGYRQWAQARYYAGHEETLQALSEHWAKLTGGMEGTTLENGAPIEDQPDQSGPAMGGMTFG